MTSDLQATRVQVKRRVCPQIDAKPTRYYMGNITVVSIRWGVLSESIDIASRVAVASGEL